MYNIFVQHMWVCIKYLCINNKIWYLSFLWTHTVYLRFCVKFACVHVCVARRFWPVQTICNCVSCKGVFTICVKYLYVHYICLYMWSECVHSKCECFSSECACSFQIQRMSVRKYMLTCCEWIDSRNDHRDSVCMCGRYTISPNFLMHLEPSAKANSILYWT